MIVVTGAAGFIGSCLVQQLLRDGYGDMVAADDFSDSEKNKNLPEQDEIIKIDRGHLFEWLKKNHRKVDFIFHIGARTDTAEFDKTIFDKLNLNYSKQLWKSCVEHGISMIYASSAATYGLGEFGYDDSHEMIYKLKPLNLYGESKNDFDKWALQQKGAPPFWAGLKFFNVYGPNEYHKGRMASVIFHAYHQIKDSGSIKLFRSHNPEYKDGEQLRDFVYVKDILKVSIFLMNHHKNAGIYNLGTGKARTFASLAKNTFRAVNKSPEILFVDTPKDIRDKYQYFTEARMNKLINIGYNNDFYTLEDGIDDYVNNYLISGKYF